MPHPDTILTTAIIGYFQTGCFAREYTIVRIPGYTVLLALIKAQLCLCFFSPMKVNIRPETKDDLKKIWRVNAAAFDTDAEANLVDNLRKSRIALISLVAEANEKLIGHILFSPVILSGNRADVKIAGLAPMSVLPDHQKQGIGAANT